MKFLVDRCAGRRLAVWLRGEGHDVAELSDGPDPGDRALLEQAAREQPDVPAQGRIDLMRQVLERHADALASGSIVTVRGGRIRISQHGP